MPLCKNVLNQRDNNVIVVELRKAFFSIANKIINYKSGHAHSYTSQITVKTTIRKSFTAALENYLKIGTNNAVTYCDLVKNHIATSGHIHYWKGLHPMSQNHVIAC